MGEVNDEGELHGVGLQIASFKGIQEAYFENGNICGETKTLSYHFFNFDQVRFTEFVRYNWKQRTGKNGYYQSLTQNGNVIEEGYQKIFNYTEERIICSQNSKKYGKKIDSQVEWWY